MNLLYAIVRSLLNVARFYLERRRVERSWGDLEKKEYPRMRKYTAATLRTHEGTMLFQYPFDPQAVGQKKDFETVGLREGDGQLYLKQHSKKQFQEIPAVPAMNTSGSGFAVVTLFYFEWAFLEPWLDHYRNQGAGHFLLYFNGNRIPSDLARIIEEQSDVTFILWPFRFHAMRFRINDGRKTEHTQAICYQHALEMIRHRTNFSHVLAVDLDEYIIGSQRIVEYAKQGVKEVSFSNVWSKNFHGFCNGENPLAERAANFKPWRRVKSLVDVSYIQHLDIHRIWHEENMVRDGYLLHFLDVPKSGYVAVTRNGDDSVFDFVDISEHDVGAFIEIWQNFKKLEKI